MKTLISALRSATPKKRAALALAMVTPAATVGVFAALFLAPGGFGQVVFLSSKIWMLLFPWLWMRFVEREPTGWPKWKTRGLGLGICGGLLIAAIIAAAYWLLHAEIDGRVIAERLAEAGLDRPVVYLALAAYWCLANSLIEEYLWRWFVASRCDRLTSRVKATLLAGFFFTVHHTVAMAAYLEWSFNLLASVGIFCGGVFWSWLYLRSENIWAAWVSHVLADIAVFTAGYLLIFA